MNKELLKMSQEELTEKIKELLEIHQVDLILKYLYQEQRINEAIELIKEFPPTFKGTDNKKCLKYEIIDILKGSDK